MFKYPSRPSELCIFRENFFNSDYVRDNGGTLVGSPTVANGITLSGTGQYATFSTTGFNLNGKTNLTYEIEFTPTFAADDSASHYLICFTTTAGGTSYVLKNSSNELRLAFGGTNLTAISLGAFSAYWNVNKKNHLAVCATSASTLVYLNNNLVGTLATAWAQTAQPATLYVGCAAALNLLFAGTIHSFSIYATKWDANEVSDAYNKITFKEIAFSNAVVHLPCKSIYANTGDGTDLGTDMDMEAADTSAWTQGVNAIISKQAGARTGGTGSTILRIARTAGGNGTAYQAAITANKYHRVTGWARTDGTGVSAQVIMGATTYTTTVATTTTWTYFDFVSYAITTANFYLYATGGADTNYVEFDDVTVQEVDFLTENLGKGADVKIGDSGLYGVTLAQNNGFVYDGANSYLDCGSDVVGTSAGTFAALVQWTGWGEGNVGTLFSNGKLVINTYASLFRLAGYSDGSTGAFAASNTLTLGSWYSFIVTRTAANPSLMNFYVNGVLSGTANQSSGNPATGTTNLIIGNNSARAYTAQGTIKYPTVWLNTVFTPTQCRELHNKLMAMINK